MSSIAKAIEALREKEFLESFDTLRPGSRPTPGQQRIIDAFLNRDRKYLIVRAGNQSMLPTSLVLMADSTVRQIATLRPGDMVKVYDKTLKTFVAAPVVKLWNNGIHPVYKMQVRGNTYINVTPNHEMLKINQVGTYRKVTAAEATHFAKIDCPPDNYSIPWDESHKKAELLGFLLGDGCFTKLASHNYVGLQYSTQRAEHVQRVTDLLEPGYYWWASSVGDYFLRSEKRTKADNDYVNWIRTLGLAGKYAHEKFIPQEYIEASPTIKLALLQGLIATDGSFTNKRLAFYSCSSRLIEGVQAILESFGLVVSIYKGKPQKETHHPDYTLEVRATKSLSWLHKNLTVSAKPVTGVTKKARNSKVALNTPVISREYIGHHEVYDITVDHPDHNYVCDGFLVGNSGKSATGMKALSVMLREEPGDTWRRPDTWVGPLLFLCLARQLKQAEESLLPKLTRHLKEGSYRVVRVGNALNKLIMENGNTVLFFSHHNTNQARDAVQSYTAHGAILDELPSDPAIIEELDKRVLVNKGSILLTFTPKVPAPKVKKYLEDLPQDRVSHITLSSLDNPSMDQETKAGMLADARARGEAFLKTILHGDWIQGDRAVFTYNPETCLRPLPEHYAPQAWRHVLSVDPATASETGVVIAAEDPLTGQWYVVHASYIKKGKEGRELAQEAERLARPYRIVRRIYDSAATWFEASARAEKLSYMPVFNKAHNKINMIQAVNTALGKDLFLAENCALDLEEELIAAQWSESARENISHGHEYHTCFAPDTHVWTEKGPRAIVDIKPGDLVWTHLGRLRPVLQVIKKENYNKPVQLNVVGTTPLQVTANHPFYTRRYQRSTEGSLTGQLRPSSDYTWKAVGHLERTQLPSGAPKSMDALYLPKLVVNSTSDASECLEAFIWGYYAAEGSKSVKSGQINFAGHVDEKIIYTDVLLRWNPRMTWRAASKGHGRRCYVGDMEAVRKAIPWGSYENKAIPEDQFPQTAEAARHFLAGYIYGDGCLSGTSIRGSTISQKLARQLQQLGAMCNIRVSLNFRRRANRWAGFGPEGKIARDAWAWDIDRMDLEKIISIFPTIWKDKKVQLGSREKPRRTRDVGDGWDCLGWTIQDTTCQEVYTLSVEEDNSYIAEGVAVKNCDALSYFWSSKPKFEGEVLAGLADGWAQERAEKRQSIYEKLFKPEEPEQKKRLMQVRRRR